MRTQLATPNDHLVGPSTYDELFTTHGVTMIFLFVIPMTLGAFGNYLVPLMIGARDMAFPRLNALCFWLFLGSGFFIYASLFLGTGPNAGWFDYVPLALRQYDPGPGVDFYALGLIFNGISSTRRGANFIVTIFKLRAPGMSLNRMPLFCFANLAASFALLFALPALTIDLVFLELQRKLRLPLLRRRPRRAAAPVAEPVLDLRASRGLHHRAAGVRDRDLDHPDLRPAADGRLSACRARRAARRVHRLRRLGAPHVRDRASRRRRWCSSPPPR